MPRAQPRLLLLAVPLLAATPSLYDGMQWRMIGPFRGGRTVAASGVPGQPHVFYIGANNGGVWKTGDFGHTWKPIFDDQPTGSIGALAIAPSDPNVIYVGSGEGLQRPDLSVGDGVYKSVNGGRTWRHLGLRDGQQIPAILVDPKNPERVFVAVLGHPYGPNAERGVFRSLDGGQSWRKVLYKDENTGAIDLAFDPADARIVYAVLWAARQGPWENAAFQGPSSGLFKSIDGGSTWQPLTSGLPTFAQGLGRIGIGVAPSDPSRLYALVDASAPHGGLYRSDDAGAHWRRINGDNRLWGRGSDFAHVRVDPKNRDTLYIANICLWRSRDAGATFRAIKGAPGGDDYHTVWINPENPGIILFASDQGAGVSVNGGLTWSSWYNQPTAQFYHVITDHQFPYWVYGGQQESGSAAVASRGDHGQITFRDWHPVGVEEYGYVAPDPLNPNIVYGGKVTRFDRSTGETQQVGPQVPRGGKYRFIRTMPLLFSPLDPRLLYLGAQVLFKTVNGGHSWDVISPDLTRESWEPPPSVGVYASEARKEATRRGVIYALAPSHQDVNTIWAGTDDGLIHRTRDGGRTWTNVTPPELTPWSKVSILEASHFDGDTAYAAVNRFRLDDLRPHIYRTHDGGGTWRRVVRGLPDDPINVVREDPQRKGLLFAGSERAVFVSFNDGEDWQPLRLNMPATSIRDLVIHQDDVVVGTHGRGFWILDDITPLRQIDARAASAEAVLFRPQAAHRVRWNKNTDTPLPPEEPAGKNPPDGAILNYYLKSPAPGPVTLEILDAAGTLVRRFASDDKPAPPESDLNIPLYWIRPPQLLSPAAGMHRFVWDLHYPPPPGGGRRQYPIAAVAGDTVREPRGPAALPGEYTVRLTAAGRTFTEPLTVKMDPRVKTPRAGLELQFQLATKLCDLMREVDGEVRKLPQAADRRQTLTRLAGELAALLGVITGADETPTTQATAAVAELERAVRPR